MPRAVLSWLRCDLCGNNPAVRDCNGRVLCERCFHAAGGRLGCGGASRRRASVDVDERIISRIRRAAYKRPG